MALTNMPTATQTGSNAKPINLTSSPAMAPALRPQQYYDRVLLEVLRQTEFGHQKFAQVRTIPKNAGTNTINFRKIGKLPPVLTPLTEGITPDGQQASKDNVTATVAQYGAYMMFSDKVSFEEIDPIIAEYTEELGYQARESLDILVREVLSAGTNVYYANGKTDRNQLAAGDKFTLKDIRRIVRDFKKNHVKPVAGRDYACFISPDTEFDVFDDPDFEKVADYGGRAQPYLDNEIGRIHGVRFFTLTNAKVFEGEGEDGSDVHAAIMIGRNAYGVVKVTGEGNVQSIVKGLGSAGTEDPLNQRQTVGWKVNAFGAVRLEELAIARYEHVPTV